MKIRHVAYRVMPYVLWTACLAYVVCVFHSVCHQWPTWGLVREWAALTLGSTAIILSVLTAVALVQWHLPGNRERRIAEVKQRYTDEHGPL